MAKQKFPFEWILAFSLTPIVIIGLVLFLIFGGGSETASETTHADVTRVIKIYPSLKPEYKQAMSDKRLDQNEANSILKKANAMTVKGKR